MTNQEVNEFLAEWLFSRTICGKGYDCIKALSNAYLLPFVKAQEVI